MSSLSPPLTERPKLSFDLARVAVLLSVSVLINYVDRGTLSIAAPVLKEDLHLSSSQLGILLSSFFWTYAAFQIVSGWLLDYVEVNWLLAAGVLLWSAATVSTGLVHGFALLLTRPRSSSASASRLRIRPTTRSSPNISMHRCVAAPTA